MTGRQRPDSSPNFVDGLSGAPGVAAVLPDVAAVVPRPCASSVSGSSLYVRLSASAASDKSSQTIDDGLDGGGACVRTLRNRHRQSESSLVVRDTSEGCATRCLGPVGPSQAPANTQRELPERASTERSWATSASQTQPVDLASDRPVTVTGVGDGLSCANNSTSVGVVQDGHQDNSPPLFLATGPVPELPTPNLDAEADFTWGDLSGQDFLHVVEAAYCEVVHWKRNVFKVPSGKAGKEFVLELARLFRSYSEATALESVALKAVMLMPHLLLQKPSPTSKAKDHCDHLTHRLQAWQLGNIDGLLREGRVIQQHLVQRRSTSSEDSHLAASFSKLILAGKTQAALRLLSSQGRGSVLPVHRLVDPADPASGNVLDALKEKHPPAQPVSVDALLNPDAVVSAPESHPVLFEGITAEVIRRAALRCGGSAGPSGLDASAWQRMCVAFKSSSVSLCEALALFSRRIYSDYVAPSGLSAFTACRLIALDKCPGVRPIGVAEVVRRIVGKAVLIVVGSDIQRVAGTTQLCAGQEGGCEAAVHATRLVFADSDSDGVLLVDARNAFNQLNRQVALYNVSLLCPPLAAILVNTYRANAMLFVDGATLFSCEGTTQGDPLAMVFYALATLPLIKACKVTTMTGEVWFADDAAGSGPITSLRTWWDYLNSEGPKFGYFPNAIKTWLVVKEGMVAAATAAFSDTAVQITASGRRHLGAALGPASFAECFVKDQVQIWVAELERLATIARSHPQAAYAAFIHGLRGKWLYLARTMLGIGDLFKPLEMALRHTFIPALTGQSAPGDLLRDLLALPARLGGLGLINPVELADLEHQASLSLTSALVRHILEERSHGDVSALPTPSTKPELRQVKQRKLARAASALYSRLPAKLQYAVELASEKGASTWLTARPLAEHGFAISKLSFRDGLCLRYGWPIDHLPSHCVCGREFSPEHALSCPTGGLPTVRHNELRDLLGSLLSEVCPDVALEPVLQPLSGEVFRRRTTTRDDDARLDIRAHGFWGSGSRSAFFDVRVFNPFAPTNHQSSLAATYRRHELAKKNRYEERVLEIERASFTPLIFSTSGGVSRLTATFLKHLASRLAAHQELPYSLTLAWLRARIGFSLLRSAGLCLRGSRSTAGHPRFDQCIALAARQVQYVDT